MDYFPWWTGLPIKVGEKCAWVRTVDPVTEPVSLTEAKDHARIDLTADDAAVTRFIQNGREEAEEYLGRGLLTQTWQLSLPNFFESMALPMAAPLQSVTSVQYYDTTGSLQTLSTSFYTVDTISRPGRVVRTANQFWPGVQADRQAGRVLITYVVGWTAANLVPERIKQGIRLYVAAADANRDGMDVDGKTALTSWEACWTDRVRWIEPTALGPEIRWPA